MKKTRQKAIATMLLLLPFLFSCNQYGTDKGEQISLPEWEGEQHRKEATIQHVVYFWLKEDVTQSEKQQFEENLEKLGTCPQILTYRWGKAVPSDRDVVDDSFDYSWIVDFANEEDLRAYGVDSIHKVFIAESEHLWKNVQVYDSTIAN